ncbi:MAG: transglycosylase SLT domain-containing protein [Pyrinomonadaceae bacterium]|nr:transglycosylase SLT domain-containing protein [Pyrinomonadaceae bacterium]
MINRQFSIASSLSLAVILGLGQVNPSNSAANRANTRSAAEPIQSANDRALASVRRSDDSSRDADKRLLRLSQAEHLRRANVYMTNRAFAEAREHWRAFIEYYPQEARIPEALLAIGRSYLQSRRNAEALSTFDQLARAFGSTKEGREGLNFSAAALLRLGKPSDAADRYAQYVDRFPQGERIDTAHLNVIDTLREAGRSQEAIAWIGRTRQRFAGTPTETNALFARLRLDVAEGDWQQAVVTADELSRKRFQKGVLTTPSESAYLKAYSLDQSAQRRAAIAAYISIPDAPDSYYGWLAAKRLNGLAEGLSRSLVKERSERLESQIADAAAQYPAPHRQAILKTAKAHKLDPRFILAIIRQESVFSPTAKSPAGARGLLQLTIDAARKYAPKAGLTNLAENDLYHPETSILVGGEYLADLAKMFPNMLEAVAASYNGGEDNVARWVKRAKQKDPGVFTAEIGFEETKAYVQKVMANYRAYRQLYTADLIRK